METEIFVLNPDYHFKNDYDRIAMYSIKNVQQDSSSNWISYIHPIQAAILNHFSKIKKISDHYLDLAKDYNLSLNLAKKMIEPYLENKTPVYTQWKTQKIYFPKNVLIPINKVVNKYNIINNKIPALDTDVIDLTPNRMHKGPQTLLFMVTNKCVTNCKYCYADRHTQYVPLTTNEILNIIDEASSLKMSYIDIIGGELFCRKDWNIILKKLVEANLMPNYISTKVPLTEEKIKLLHDTGYNNVVQISLDSLNDYILQKIIGTSIGYVQKIKNTITLLEKYGFKIQIDTILTKFNSDIKSILELFNYIKSLHNIKYWEIRVPEVSIYTPNEFKEIKADKHILKNLRDYIKNNLNRDIECPIIYSDDVLENKYHKGKPEDDYFRGGSCGFLKENMFVLPDGKVSVCEQLYWHPKFIIGDLKKQSLCEIWNSDKALKLLELNKTFLREKSTCYQCKALNICNKKRHKCIVKIIKAYGTENWDYPDPRCIFAPTIMSDLIY